VGAFCRNEVTEASIASVGQLIVSAGAKFILWLRCSPHDHDFYGYLNVGFDAEGLKPGDEHPLSLSGEWKGNSRKILWGAIMFCVGVRGLAMN